MNDLLDRIETDPLANLRPQSVRENERALAFAIELTGGTPALDAVRGRGILASMIAEQRLQLEERAQATEQAGTGFSRPSNRVIAGSRNGRVSAEGSFALPATLRPTTSRPQHPGSRISAHANGDDQSFQSVRPVRSDRRVSPGVARAQDMGAAPASNAAGPTAAPGPTVRFSDRQAGLGAPAALLGNSVRGPQPQRLRTVDAPAYGRSAPQTSAQTPNRTPNRPLNRPADRPSSRPSDRTAQSTTPLRGFATNGALALADPDFVPFVSPRAKPEAKATTPALRVLRGGKTVGMTRKKVLGALAIIALVSIAFAAVFMHASLARTQLSIDKLNIDITQAERMNQRLRVQVATLEAPDRIVSVAQELGLEPPKTVRFLPTAAPIALAATRIVR